MQHLHCARTYDSVGTWDCLNITSASLQICTQREEERNRCGSNVWPQGDDRPWWCADTVMQQFMQGGQRESPYQERSPESRMNQNSRPVRWGADEKVTYEIVKVQESMLTRQRPTLLPRVKALAYQCSCVPCDTEVVLSSCSLLCMQLNDTALG